MAHRTWAWQGRQGERLLLSEGGPRFALPKSWRCPEGISGLRNSKISSRTCRGSIIRCLPVGIGVVHLFQHIGFSVCPYVFSLQVVLNTPECVTPSNSLPLIWTYPVELHLTQVHLLTTMISSLPQPRNRVLCRQGQQSVHHLCLMTLPSLTMTGKSRGVIVTPFKREVLPSGDRILPLFGSIGLIVERKSIQGPYFGAVISVGIRERRMDFQLILRSRQ